MSDIDWDRVAPPQGEESFLRNLESVLGPCEQTKAKQASPTQGGPYKVQHHPMQFWEMLGPVPAGAIVGKNEAEMRELAILLNAAHHAARADLLKVLGLAKEMRIAQENARSCHDNPCTSDCWQVSRDAEAAFDTALAKLAALETKA